MLISQTPPVVTIDVTPFHLLVADEEMCPVGLAVQQRLPQVNEVMVDEGNVQWEHDGARWSYPLPEDVAEAIQEWRDGKYVGPFSFFMDNRDAIRV